MGSRSVDGFPPEAPRALLRARVHGDTAGTRHAHPGGVLPAGERRGGTTAGPRCREAPQPRWFVAKDLLASLHLLTRLQFGYAYPPMHTRPVKVSQEQARSCPLWSPGTFASVWSSYSGSTGPATIMQQGAAMAVRCAYTISVAMPGRRDGPAGPASWEGEGEIEITRLNHRASAIGGESEETATHRSAARALPFTDPSWPESTPGR
jgi:hypothetical protein